jgi:hypothetical protein
MWRVRRIVLALAAAALTGSAGAAAAFRPAAARVRSEVSGLHGIVYRGPTTPVCRAGVPCEAPAAGVTLRFTRPGLQVVQAVTRADGSYRILLPPGIYRVAPARASAYASLAPTRVRVRRAHVDRLDFHLDTGIR